MFILFLGTSIFLHSYNTELQTKNVELSDTILEIEERINLLNYDISKTTSFENISEIAKESGLVFNEANVIYVSEELRGRKFR